MAERGVAVGDWRARLPDEQQVGAERGPFAGMEGQLDAPFKPTPPAIVARMLELARVGPGDRLIDLGCGDGRIVIAAAKRGASAVGVDLDPARVAEAGAAAMAASVGERTSFLTGDLFGFDLGEFDVVTLFLAGHVNRWLEAKLQCELKPGARVVGYAFPMPNWPPAAQEAHERIALYLWVR